MASAASPEVAAPFFVYDLFVLKGVGSSHNTAVGPSGVVDCCDGVSLACFFAFGLVVFGASKLWPAATAAIDGLPSAAPAASALFFEFVFGVFGAAAESEAIGKLPPAASVASALFFVFVLGVFGAAEAAAAEAVGKLPPAASVASALFFEFVLGVFGAAEAAAEAVGKLPPAAPVASALFFEFVLGVFGAAAEAEAVGKLPPAASVASALFFAFVLGVFGAAAAEAEAVGKLPPAVPVASAIFFEYDLFGFAVAASPLPVPPHCFAEDSLALMGWLNALSASTTSARTGGDCSPAVSSAAASSPGFTPVVSGESNKMQSPTRIASMLAMSAVAVGSDFGSGEVGQPSATSIFIAGGGGDGDADSSPPSVKSCTAPPHPSMADALVLTVAAVLSGAANPNSPFAAAAKHATMFAKMWARAQWRYEVF